MLILRGNCYLELVMEISMITILAVATLLPGGCSRCTDKVLVGTSEDGKLTLCQFRQKGGGA